MSNLKNTEKMVEDYRKLEKKYAEISQKLDKQVNAQNNIPKIVKEAIEEFLLYMGKVHDANIQDYDKMTVYRNALVKHSIKLPESKGQ